MTLAGSEKPRPLRQQTANGQGSFFSFFFFFHSRTIGSIVGQLKGLEAAAAEGSKAFLAALQKKSHSTRSPQRLSEETS